MIVKGMVSVDVDISLKEALKVVVNGFGFSDIYGNLDEDLVVLEKTDEMNKTGKKGLFRIEEKSYHGSANYECVLVSDNLEKIENFLHIKALLENSKKL